MIVTKDTIKVFAEACGITDLADDVATTLASDVEYRLREISQEAAKFCRHAKRRRLTTEDVNCALRLRNLEPIYGYSSLAPASVSEASTNGEKWGFRKLTDCFYIPDEVIDLTHLLNAELPKCPVEVTFTSHWLAVEGVQPKIPQNPRVVTPDNDELPPVYHEIKPTEDPNAVAAEVKDVKTPGAAVAKDDVEAVPVKHKPLQVFKPITKHDLSLEQQLYYQSVTQGLIENNSEYVEHACDSLKRDPGLHSLLPYFAQFVIDQVTKNLGHTAILSNMVRLTESLLANPNLFPLPYLHQLLPAVITCVVGRVHSSPSDDHWAVRRRAANVTKSICDKFGKGHSVQTRVTKMMIEAVLNPKRALATQYGAIITLTRLGPLVLDASLMGNIKIYHASLKLKKGTSQDNFAKDVTMVEDALLDACRVYRIWVDNQNAGPVKILPDSDITKRYNDIESVFGDRLGPRV